MQTGFEEICICEEKEDFYKKKSILWDQGIAFDVRTVKGQNGQEAYALSVQTKDREQAMRAIYRK